MLDSRHNSEINFFGLTNFRRQAQKFGIKLDDRRRHMYLIGKTGMGKTTLLENMIIQDIRHGHGVAYVDPHGDTAERLMDYIPASRVNDVLYINPADLKYPVAFNILESVNYEHRHLVASGLMGVFTKIWADAWSARMEYILNNTILSLLEVPGNTLLGVNRMLVDKEFRKKIVSRLRDPVIKTFWMEEYANWSDNFRREAISAIQNKVGQFLSSAVIRNIVGQAKSSIDLREVMDKKKIVIINLSKGRLGEDASALLGGMIITKLQLAAMSRVDILEHEREDFFLYVDEFQNFATKSFADILSEARKYRLSLILTHQFIAQLSEEVRDAVFGNVGTIVALRIGAQDAEFLEKEFEPHFRAEDLVNLTKFQMCLKLMIDGVASRPFSAFSLPPLHEGAEHIENKDKVIKVSRERYSKPADQVEDKIVRWMGLEDVGETETEVEGRVKRFDENRAKPAQPTANAVCDNCAKPTYIAFKPDDKRNVFCKDCLPKFKQGVIDAGSLTKRNIAAPATQPRIEPRSKSDAAKVSETAGQAKPARQERTADLASQPAHTPQNQTPTDGNVAPGQIVELNK